MEKTPNHLLFLDEIANCIPDARFVHVLRRGIDVVASISDADMQVETRAFSGGTVRWARRWNRAMGMHLAHLGEPRHYLLCLEDLIGSADEEWRILQEFLVLDPGKPLLGRPGCDVTDARTEPWKASAVSGIAKSVSGKSQAVFGPRSLAWLRQHLVSYGAIRDAIREQHRTNMDWTRHSVEHAGRRGVATRMRVGRADPPRAE